MSPRQHRDGVRRAAQAVLASGGSTRGEGGADGQPHEHSAIRGVLRRGLPEPQVTLDDAGMVLDDELGLTLSAGWLMRRGHLRPGDSVLVVPVGDSRFVLVDRVLFGAERARGGEDLSIEDADTAGVAGAIGGGGGGGVPPEDPETMDPED